MRTRPFLPRPEYPRPDWQRGLVNGVDWINLNGAWEFRFDPQRIGVEQRWFEGRSERWSEQIIVPFCWESLAAWGQADAAGNDHYFSTRVYKNPLEVTERNYRSASRHEVGWYKRQIRIPLNKSWVGKRVILKIGAADYITEAWCNAQWLGSNEGGYLPFEFDITDALQKIFGDFLEGTIVFRVEDPMLNSEQPVGKQWGWYSSVSGIWQTVYLEPRAPIYIKHYEVVPDIDKQEAIIRIRVTGGSRLTIDITSPTGERSISHSRITNNEVLESISLKPVELWDTIKPQLYRLKLTLHGGDHSDVVYSYFGMRSIFSEPCREGDAPGALRLNGEPIYLRGALYQSYFSEGIYTAGNVQALQDDIAWAKRAGFDLLRVHVKIDDPLLYYYADTLGILVMADFPNFGEGGDTPRGRERYEKMMREAIHRDFNHPSIIAWCLFNETWGFGGLTEFVKLINPSPPIMGNITQTQDPLLASKEVYNWIQKMWGIAKSLDPTRLVEDMSVVAWEHLQYYGHGETDVNSWHFYSDDYQWARKHIEEVVEKTRYGSTYNYVQGFQQTHQPLIASEYGGIGALDGDVDVSWSFKFLTNELRKYPQLSAYIYTELHDVEWERNGFLNYDRTPKAFGYDPLIVNQGDVLPIDSPPISYCNPSENVTTPIYASHFSRKPQHNITLFWRLSGIDSLGWVHDDIVMGNKPIPFTHYKVELAHLLELKMPDAAMLCTLWVQAVSSEGIVVARNYIQFFINKDFKLSEEVGGSVILRAAPYLWSTAEWNGGFSSNLEAREKGQCYGTGHGFFEWILPIDRIQVLNAQRIHLVCEASACRFSTPQTDSFNHPTALTISINGVSLHRSLLPNHPHDAGGALSYLRGGRGAYGYLIRAIAEGALLREILNHMEGESLRLRFSIPIEDFPHGGLTIYGQDSGRYPLAPTLIIEDHGVKS